MSYVFYYLWRFAQMFWALVTFRDMIPNTDADVLLSASTIGIILLVIISAFRPKWWIFLPAFILEAGGIVMGAYLICQRDYEPYYSANPLQLAGRFETYLYLVIVFAMLLSISMLLLLRCFLVVKKEKE